MLADHLVCRPNRQCFEFQGKGPQKTFWLDGREDLALPLLSHSEVDIITANGDKTALRVHALDD